MGLSRQCLKLTLVGVQGYPLTNKLEAQIPAQEVPLGLGTTSAISKESIRRSDTQLVAKQPRVESTLTDAVPASRPSSSSASPSYSSKAKVSLAAFMDQLQLMRTDFGSRLDHIFDEMCQMNTRIGCIACLQSHLGGFAPSPSPKPTKQSFLNGGDDDDDNDSCSKSDDEMIDFQ